MLAGALTDLALADVLQLLELGARSGVLVVDGGPLGAGRVLVQRGLVTAVVTGDGHRVADTPTAVADLLDIPGGRWAFYAGDPGAPGREPSPAWDSAVAIGTLLLDAARRRDERGRRDARVAAADADVFAVRLPDGGRDSAGRLTAAHLRVLGALDGRRDVRGVAAAVRSDVSRVRGAIAGLRALGLVEVVRPASCRREEA